MASKKITVEVDVEIEPSLKALKELKRQLKDTAAGSVEFKKITEQIRDVEDALEEAKVGSEDFLGSLENAGGPLGLLGKGIRQAEIAFSSFNTALKASVIGLLAAAVGGLVAAFMENEAAMKKLEPIFIAFEKILGGIFRAFEPVLDAFVELAMDILPYVTKGIGIFYSAIFALFTYIKTAGGAVIDFWKSLLSFDFEGAGNAIRKGLGAFQETAKAYDESMKRFTAGTNEMTKTEKENADKLAEIEKKKKEDREKALKDREDNLQRNFDLDVAIVQRNKALALSQAQTEKEVLNVTEKYSKLLYDVTKASILQRQKLYSTDSAQYKQYAIDLINLEAKFIEDTATNKKNAKALLDKELKDGVDAYEKYKQMSKSYDKLLTDLEISAIEDATEKAIAAQDEKSAQEEKTLIDANAEYVRLQSELFNKRIITQEQYQEDYEKAEQNLTEGLEIIEKNRTKAIEKIKEDARNAERDKRIKAIDEELQLLGLQSQSLLQNTTAYFQNRRDIIDASERKEIEAAKGVEEQILAIQKKYAEQRVQLKKDETAAVGKIISESIDAIANLTNVLASSYDKEAETSEKAFNQRKKLQKATALMSAASGIIQILTQPSTLPSPFDFIVKGINAAALGISTAVQIKNIDKTTFQAPSGTGSSTPVTSGPIQVQRRARGGMITGPGTSTSDSIPALLSNGEFVVNARATESFQPLLSAINNFGLQPRFAAGGLFETASLVKPNKDGMNDTLTSIMSNQPIKTYVTANDVTSQQQFERIIKTRSLI